MEHPKTWYLARWTHNGRDWVQIADYPAGPVVACGSREAVEAASRLLFDDDWQVRQFWRQEYYRLTGKMVF